MQYLFGHIDLAARRLKAVAEVFAESTRPFRLEAKAGCPPVSLDMVVLAGIINLRGDCRSSEQARRMTWIRTTVCSNC